jgi:REP element-mobilizing transposase RayT
MGWPLRMFSADGLYFVTCRTMQSRLLLRPDSQVNEVVGGVLARAAELYTVDIHAFVFASNHLHLIVRAEGNSLSQFMKYLLGNIAKKVGTLVNWRGCFWGRRYSAEAILDDEALLGRLKYVLAHGVKEGLVARCVDWPGLSCLPQLLGSARRSFQWFNWTRRWNARRRLAPNEARLDSEWAEAVWLEVKPLPMWRHLSEEERRERVRELVACVDAEAGRVSETDKPLLGAAGVRKQHPHSKPLITKKSPRPLCHASTLETRRAFRDAYREFVRLFRSASALWRAGSSDAPFPPYAFRPGFCAGRQARPLAA